MTTEEGNRLIMFFDGAQESEIEIMGKICHAIKYNNSYYPLDAADRWPQFQKDWNLLMPVVEKIESTCRGTFQIDSAEVSWYHPGSLNPVRYANHGLFHVGRNFEKKKDYVWQCCVQFIQWYNSNPQNQ